MLGYEQEAPTSGLAHARTEKQRRLAAAQELLETDKSQTQIAEDHGVTPSAVPKWKSTLEEEGLEGLKSTNDEGNQ